MGLPQNFSFTGRARFVVIKCPIKSSATELLAYTGDVIC